MAIVLGQIAVHRKGVSRCFEEVRRVCRFPAMTNRWPCSDIRQTSRYN